MNAAWIDVSDSNSRFIYVANNAGIATYLPQIAHAISRVPDKGRGKGARVRRRTVADDLVGIVYPGSITVVVYTRKSPEIHHLVSSGEVGSRLGACLRRSSNGKVSRFSVETGSRSYAKICVMCCYRMVSLGIPAPRRHSPPRARPLGNALPTPAEPLPVAVEPQPQPTRVKDFERIGKPFHSHSQPFHARNSCTAARGTQNQRPPCWPKGGRVGASGLDHAVTRTADG